MNFDDEAGLRWVPTSSRSAGGERAPLASPWCERRNAGGSCPECIPKEGDGLGERGLRGERVVQGV
ncbi:hypothetical protein, partial [Rhodococcus sp. CH91]|uniref:hypothetical protein n=1 Tax=Rhodococcus sp. CH91 TaxID=2910256 RepID=UPI001F4B6C81